MSESTNSNHFSLDEPRLRAALTDTPISAFTDVLIDAVNVRLSTIAHGDLPRWQAALEALPELPITHVDLDHEAGVAVLTDVEIAADAAAANSADQPDATNATDATEKVSTESSVAKADKASDIANGASDRSAAAQDDNALHTALQGLKPWRKGPYRVAHVNIDTEWRSDWKWNRVYPHITPLQNRTVLDVGCGNGYHLWRMRAQGASTVLGIDPSLLFMLQFQAIQKYVNDSAVSILPLTSETLPPNMHCFDTVFSMGVLYHRKDPHAHLNELMQSLRGGGELVLESLVALGEDENQLQIDGRYARMKNVWSLPSVPLLARWLHEAGFKNIRCVSVDITSRLEQRTTQWMPFESLIESLDPDDLSLTCEGLPRPRRAVMIATAPD